MQFKDKVFKVLVDNNLFGKNYVAAIGQVSKILHCKKQDVVDAVRILQSEKLVSFRNKRICNGAELKSGIITVFPNGSGYVTFEGDEKRYLVADVKDANDGDTVKVCINSKAEKPTAFVDKVTSRCKSNIMGRVAKKDGYYYFIPDNRKYGTAITILQDETAKSAVGKKCCLSGDPVSYLKTSVVFGTITKILGMAGDPIVENVAIAEQYGFVKEFPKEVEDYVRNLPTEVSDNEREGRVDLCDKNFVTIDPKTCKDMDDAVCVERTSNGGYKLYVAIADVSHYVPKNSVLDKEAKQRGTSSYLGDGVYPMLPDALSSGICSLKEGKDRLCKVVELELSPKCEIVGRKFYNAIINSKHKLCYEEAEDIHFNRNNEHIHYKDIKNSIDDMYKISNAFLKERLRGGELRFETDEVQFELDEAKTKVLGVSNSQQLLQSTEIIESFMIAANLEVGKALLDRELPVLLRTLIGPNNSRISILNDKLKEFGIRPLAGQFDYKRLVDDINKSPLKDYLTMQALKSIGKAIYEPNQCGHFCFGPNVRTYCHFTAPIRRYPDLIIHRILESVFEKSASPYSFEDLILEGLIASKRELDAYHAEMDSEKLMKSMWAENQVGKSFNGNIYDITETSVIVKLDNKVEISVPFGNLANGGQFKVNDSKTILKTETKTYKIGDKMKVSLLSADRVSRNIVAKEERYLQNTNSCEKEMQ